MKQNKKNIVPKNITLGLADNQKTDKKTNTKRPSDTSVEQTRDWSIENKL
ncbi:MAG: hypothetical protein IJC06_03525 [Clostridia bacterium]|nr:hypothetical protein [Clostridia bacterium]